MKGIRELEKRIGYTFRDRRLLETALTHSSFANENHEHVLFNERLEFLGDSVLGMITADYLFRTYPEKPEGELTKMRAVRVCEKTLSEFAQEIELGEYMRFGKGEALTGGRHRPSILADAFESLIAAMYLDAGLERTREFVLSYVTRVTQDSMPITDYKSLLQEIIQRNHSETLEYMVVAESGPDHCKEFTVEVYLNSNVIASGSGTSKKRAEQAAAKEALRLMGVETE